MVLIKYSGKYVKIYFNMKITFVSSTSTFFFPLFGPMQWFPVIIFLPDDFQ